MNAIIIHMSLRKNKNVELELKVLSKIQKNEKVSQRSISKDLNVALGFSNALIKKLVKKGFLKLSQAPMQRYFYYITPKGLIEKANLTKQFLKSSLDFYKRAKDDYESEFIKLKKLNYKNIILAGTGELAEIAILASNYQEVKIHFIYDNKAKQKTFCGYKVLKKFNKNFNKTNTVFILSESQTTNDVFNEIKKKFNIHIPQFLNL